jgi:hypothetical protein
VLVRERFADHHTFAIGLDTADRAFIELDGLKQKTAIIGWRHMAMSALGQEE